MTEALHEILYCSVLAPDQPPTVVGQIVGHARARNAERAITGLLVFDGLRFCQHLEGPRGDLLELMQRIGQDARHAQVRVMYGGPLDQRRYHRFDMGFADYEGAGDMGSVGELEGIAALQRFLDLRPGFDVNG
jgi:hypothetical protein